MAEANFVDKTIWTGDNLDILRGLNSESASYKKHKHVLFGRQEGVCNECRIAFLFPNLTIDHAIPRSRGGADHLGSLQLLCGERNSIKGDREMAYLIAKLKEREG